MRKISWWHGQINSPFPRSGSQWIRLKFIFFQSPGVDQVWFILVKLERLGTILYYGREIVAEVQHNLTECLHAVWIALVMLFKWRVALDSDQDLPWVYSSYYCQIASRSLLGYHALQYVCSIRKAISPLIDISSYTKTEPKLFNDYFSMLDQS